MNDPGERFSVTTNASYHALMSTLDAIRTSLSSPRALLAAYERYGAWLPKAASLLLTIVLARMAAELVWVLVPQPAASAWQPPPGPPAASSAAKGVDLNAIASANLFGQYQAVHTDIIDKHVRESTLNLTLLGVFAWDEKLSRAIILPQGGEAKPFAIGDTVVAGATLQQVLPDRAILSRNGKLEALRLKKGSTDGGADAGDGDGDNGDDNSPAEEDQGNNDEEPASSVGEVRNVLLSDPSRAAEFIRVMPLNAGNGLNGYRVYPGPDRTLFTGTGLRPGDVVTAVNGVQLNDPARAIQMLGDLAHTNNLSITVNRGGTNQNIQVNMNQ